MLAGGAVFFFVFFLKTIIITTINILCIFYLGSLLVGCFSEIKIVRMYVCMYFFLPCRFAIQLTHFLFTQFYNKDQVSHVALEIRNFSLFFFPFLNSERRDQLNKIELVPVWLQWVAEQHTFIISVRF